MLHFLNSVNHRHRIRSPYRFGRKIFGHVGLFKHRNIWPLLGRFQVKYRIDDVESIRKHLLQATSEIAEENSVDLAGSASRSKLPSLSCIVDRLSSLLLVEVSHA
jgi:hypothetical protein